MRASLSSTPPHYPNLKSKINITLDQTCVNVWSAKGERMDLPSAFRILRVCANISIRSVWATKSMFGLIYQTEDLMVCESEGVNICPFETMVLELPEHEAMEEDA